MIKNNNETVELYRVEVIGAKDGYFHNKRVIGPTYSFSSSEECKYLNKYILCEKPKKNDKTIKEVLTGVEFDRVYTKTKYEGNHWRPFHGFYIDNPTIVVDDSIMKEASLEEIKEYLNAHADIEKYQEELENFKKEAEEIKNKKIAEESDEALAKRQVAEEKRSLINKIIDMRTKYQKTHNGGGLIH